jgi:putative membrane protein
MKHLLGYGLVAVLALTSACSSTAGDVADDEAGASSRIDSQQFVTAAAESNLAEIEASQLAVSKTQNPDIRAYAQRMIDDHRKANEQLAAVARAEMLNVPDDTDAKHKAVISRLEAKSGPGFDSAYVQQMTEDHDKAISLFRAAAASDAVDARLGSLAQTLLPTLEEHRDMVAQLQANPSVRSASESDQGAATR